MIKSGATPACARMWIVESVEFVSCISLQPSGRRGSRFAFLKPCCSLVFVVSLDQFEQDTRVRAVLRILEIGRQRDDSKCSRVGVVRFNRFWNDTTGRILHHS